MGHNEYQVARYNPEHEWQRIDLPKNVNIPLWDKVKVRALLAHENVKYNIMIKQGNTWYAPRNEVRNLRPIQQEV